MIGGCIYEKYYFRLYQKTSDTCALDGDVGCLTTFRYLDYTESYGTVIDKWLIGKGLKGSGPGLLSDCPGICF
jgi:hypothetical protein